MIKPFSQFTASLFLLYIVQPIGKVQSQFYYTSTVFATVTEEAVISDITVVGVSAHTKCS